MARPDFGSKRQCQNCGTKFFDLNKDPITCPKCGTVFQTVAVGRTTRSAAATRDEEDTEAEAIGPEVVSLEDAEPSEKAEAADDGDLEVEDVPADDTFLEEEEEENDDVADLIDGDIEDDEEG